MNEPLSAMKFIILLFSFIVLFFGQRLVAKPNFNQTISEIDHFETM